jgi:hypothetical protein
MRHKQNVSKEEQSEIRHQTGAASADALGAREVYPPEEFAGFENFGEFPEWHPGQAEGKISGDEWERTLDPEIPRPDKR